jgi:hypothetical protein
MNTIEILTQVLLLSLTAILLYILYKRALRLLTRGRINAKYGRIVDISWSGSGDDQQLVIQLDMPEAGSGELSFERDGRSVGTTQSISYGAGLSRHDIGTDSAISLSANAVVLWLPNQKVKRNFGAKGELIDNEKPRL